MYIDFHYYMIKALAQMAGFNDAEAQDIAYASEYVDDALEYLPMKITDIPDLDYGTLLMPDGLFDVVCTAHDKFTMIGGALIKGQLNTYIPFHFVPRHTKQVDLALYDFRTSPNCDIGRQLVETAVFELKQARGDNRTRKLIKLGIALHTYADTWAHQDFSGIFNPKDNAVAGMEIFVNGQWEKKDLDVLPSIVPETGHAKAHYFPDCSHSTWRYYNGVTRERIERDNRLIFLDAARNIYDFLCAASGLPNRWEKCRERVSNCISFDSGLPLDDTLGKKCEHYKKVFQDVAFFYDEHEWKENALTAYDSSSNKISFKDKTLDHRNVESLTSFKLPENVLKGGLEQNITYRFNRNAAGNLKWFYFHLEALKQREFVKERIPVGDNVRDGQISDGQVGRIVTNSLEKLLNSWSLTAAATRLEGKSRWLLVEIENRTPHPIVWRGSYDGDYDLPGAYGRYWDRPTNIAGFSRGGFSACEKDQAPTGCGAVTGFLIIHPNGETPFSIGISNPFVSEISNPIDGIGRFLDSLTTHKFKCRATFESDRHGVWENLDRSYEEGATEYCDKSGLQLTCRIEQDKNKATVIVSQA